MYARYNYMCRNILNKGEIFLKNDICKLISDNDSLVHYFVRRLSKGGYEYDDLVQVGRIGLLKAAKTYNGSTKFATYAARCISNELFMYFRKNNKHYFNIVSLDDAIGTDLEGNEITYGMVIEDAGSNFNKLIEDLDTITKVFNIALNRLSAREVVIWLCVISGKNQRYVGELLNISQSYISRICSRVSKKLQTMYKNNVKYEEAYHMNINSNGCSITFLVEDVEKINTLIINSLKSVREVSQVNVSRNGSKICVFFPNVEESFETIAILISTIDKYSIKLVKMAQGESIVPENQIALKKQETIKKETITEDKKNSVKNLSPAINAVTESTKSNSKCRKIMEYIISLDEFCRKDLSTKFPEFSNTDINNAIYIAKKRGYINSLRRGTYTVCKGAII